MSDTSGSGRSSLHEALHHLAHLLPGQGPLAEFVHHNTLHGEQHLDFEQALASSAARTGARPYLEESAFREAWRRGRINAEDLDQAIGERLGAQADELLSFGPRSLPRRDLVAMLMVHDLDPLPPAQLRWRLQEEGADRQLLPSLTPSKRAQLLAWHSEPDSAYALWLTVLTRLGLSDPRTQLPEQRPALSSPEEVMDRAMHLLPELFERPCQETLRTLSGVDVSARVNPQIIRWCGAFLDEGLSSWPMSGREQGLWSAWRSNSGQTETLPQDPLSALEHALRSLGVPEGRWEGILLHSALSLPGFSGMAAWRESHPSYAAQQRHPLHLLDLMAMRLTLERQEIRRLCQELWGVDFPELREVLQARPAELILRCALHGGALPDDTSARARDGLAHGGPEAHMLVAREIVAAQRDRGNTLADAWPLYCACQHLGLDATLLRGLPEEQLQGLLSELSAWPRSRRLPVWLCAYEGNYREQILSGLAQNRARIVPAPTRPAAQLVFCIDDREEAFRRHLEEQDPEVETFGVAGFFGVPIWYKGQDDLKEVPLCPVVVTPAHRVHERSVDAAQGQRRAQASQRWDRLIGTWQSLRRDLLGPLLAMPVLGPLAALPLGAVALAPSLPARALERVQAGFLPEAATRLGLDAETNEAASPQAPRLGFTLAEQADRVAATLRNIGLTRNFAPVVLCLGHGSISRNNPHLAAYDCGACGGRHGGPNARAFAEMANRPEVRALLAQRGIQIPEDTWFIGSEHNTCDESVTAYDLDQMPSSIAPHWARCEALLAQAQRWSAHERCRKFMTAPLDIHLGAALAHVIERSQDLAQARPELGHATNACAIVGRRALTRGLFLDRRAFLISYDPAQDATGNIVEGILAAVGPVGAGINLEYYFSTVDNERYGCGTKVPHNLMGLMGVMEGAGSDLRTGLPRQMIEIHEAMRLLLVVEATPERLGAIYANKPELAELIGKRWLHLVSMHPETGDITRFVAGQGFVPWSTPPRPTPSVPSSVAWYAGHRDFLAPALVGEALEHGHV